MSLKDTKSPSTPVESTSSGLTDAASTLVSPFSNAFEAATASSTASSSNPGFLEFLGLSGPSSPTNNDASDGWLPKLGSIGASWTTDDTGPTLDQRAGTGPTYVPEDVLDPVDGKTAVTLEEFEKHGANDDLAYVPEDKIDLATDGQKIQLGRTLTQTDGSGADTERRQTGMGASVDKSGDVRINGASSVHKGDRKTGSSYGFTWDIGRNGGSIGYNLGRGGFRVKGGLGLKIGEDGSIESIDGSGGGELGNGSLGVSGGFKPMTVAVDGTTVTWDHAIHAGGNGGRKGVFEGSGSAKQSTAFSRTFATEEEAKTFAETFDPHTTDTREMDFSALEDGEALSYSRIHDLGVSAGLMAQVKAEADGGEHLSVTRNGDTLDMTYDIERDVGAGAGIHNGILGTDGQRSRERSAHASIQVDRNSDAAVQALQDLADGTITLAELQEADIPGVSIQHTTGVEWCDEGNKDLWAAELSEKHCEGSGTYSDTETGESGDTVTGGSQERESRWFHWAYELLGGTGHSRAGTYEDDLTAYKPTMKTFEGEDGTHLYARQNLNFEAHENSRRLRDQVDHGNDLEHFTEGLGGGREKEQWVLETVVDAEGTQNIADAFSKNTPYEWQAQKQISGLKRQLADGTLTYEEAMAQLVDYGGEDAIEGFHQIAGEDHAERFLMKPGSEVWIGRDENELMDVRVRDALEEGNVEQLEALLASEAFRAAMLTDDKSIPNELIEEEQRRIDERVDRMAAALNAGVE